MVKMEETATIYYKSVNRALILVSTQEFRVRNVVLVVQVNVLSLEM